MAKKAPKITENFAGGFDLIVERDSGNEVRILTGKKESSRAFWRRMAELAEVALLEMKAEK